MIKKLRNQPYAPKWEQEEEKKTLYSTISKFGFGTFSCTRSSKWQHPLCFPTKDIKLFHASPLLLRTLGRQFNPS
jgi:hypothetical protein